MPDIVHNPVTLVALRSTATGLNDPLFQTAKALNVCLTDTAGNAVGVVSSGVAYEAILQPVNSAAASASSASQCLQDAVGWLSITFTVMKCTTAQDNYAVIAWSFGNLGADLTTVKVNGDAQI